VRHEAADAARRKDAEVKTLLIDNYDSFTFNLYQYLAEINCEPPTVIRNDEAQWCDVVTPDIDNIVISPGPGRPERNSDFGICRQAILESPLPILGVCLGHQGIGHLFGGKVKNAPHVMHGRLSHILHLNEGIFAGIPSPFRAVRYNSLVVDGDLPPDLRATAWTSDGILMGLAHRSKPIWGVQFHPESICTEHGHTLLRNFQRLTARGRESAKRTFLGSIPAEIRQPVLDSVVRLSLRHRRLRCHADPEAVFSRYFAESRVAFWLHSALIREGMSRFSFMGDASAPGSSVVSYRSRDRHLVVRKGETDTLLRESIFDYLSREMERYRCDDIDLPFDFTGGFVGYFGYELKQECGAKTAHVSSQPDAMFIFTNRFIAFDHLTGDVYLVALVDREDETLEPWFEQMTRGLHAIGQPPPPKTGHKKDPVIFKLRQDRATYLNRIDQVLNEIQAGETYEVCLTNELTAEISVDAFSLYRTLQKLNPAPFSAFLKFPDFAVLSSSPERFLRIDRGGRVEAKPIKGTLRRSFDPTEDKHLAEQLRNDEKSRSENLMIVDLLRNDIGRVCDVGSVRVTKLMEIESYATVHHLVSTIEGTLADHRSVVDCIKAAFPGGSMTGAPKIRTMEIIDRLENAARGIYSGAIGYLSLNGAVDLNIVIRTIVAAGNQASMGIGGAIVAMSDPTDEFEETMLKAKALIQAIVMAERGSLDGTAFRVEGAEIQIPAPTDEGRALRPGQPRRPFLREGFIAS
jgi:para-aminobenzoate synthetase